MFSQYVFLLFDMIKELPVFHTISSHAVMSSLPRFSSNQVASSLPQPTYNTRQILEKGLDVYVASQEIPEKEAIDSPRMKTFAQNVSELTAMMEQNNPLPKEWVSGIREKFHQLTYHRGDTISKKLIEQGDHATGHIIPSLKDPELFSYMLSTFASIHQEISKIPKPQALAEGQKKPKAVIIGSGPYPQSAISLALNGWDTTAVDLVADATKRSEALTEKYPEALRKSIHFKTMDGTHFNYHGADLVIVAAMVHPKDKVIERIKETADPKKVKVVLRTSSKDATSLLYERFTNEDAKKLGLEPEQKLYYYLGHDITSYLFQFSPDAHKHATPLNEEPKLVHKAH
ncbi:MAG: nicotianamine synthase family protein [Vampirovibrionales bacterium]